jgi:hypothetical protein
MNTIEINLGDPTMNEPTATVETGQTKPASAPHSPPSATIPAAETKASRVDTRGVSQRDAAPSRPASSASDPAAADPATSPERVDGQDLVFPVGERNAAVRERAALDLAGPRPKGRHAQRAYNAGRRMRDLELQLATAKGEFEDLMAAYANQVRRDVDGEAHEVGMKLVETLGTDRLARLAAALDRSDPALLDRLASALDDDGVHGDTH